MTNNFPIDPNDPPPVRVLIKRLANERFSTRFNAALELAEMEDERAITVLLEGAASEDEETSETAYEALALIAGPTGLVVEEENGDLILVSGEASIPFWAEMLYLDEKEVVESAITMLEAIGSEAALAALAEWDSALDDEGEDE